MTTSKLHPVTAKVTCTSKGLSADELSTTLGFSAHYQDKNGELVNQEWAHATPHLGINMTVKSDVGDLFEEGAHYELSFTRER